MPLEFMFERAGTRNDDYGMEYVFVDPFRKGENVFVGSVEFG